MQILQKSQSRSVFTIFFKIFSRDLIDTHHIITLIIKSWTNMILISLSLLFKVVASILYDLNFF